VLDVIALSELSDEPGTRGMFSVPSSRLGAVLSRMSKHHAVRIERTLMSRALLTLASLQTKSRSELLRTGGFGPTYVTAIEDALEDFGLRLAGAEIVVRDHATPLEANALRLHKWVDERLAEIYEALMLGTLEGNPVEWASRDPALKIEREVLADVMLILDGREPTNKRGLDVKGT
jgi:hypothetical protein